MAGYTDSIRVDTQGVHWIEHPHHLLCNKKGEHLAAECLFYLKQVAKPPRRKQCQVRS